MRSIQSDNPELASLSPSLTIGCALAVEVPRGALDSPPRTTDLWLFDRASLVECRERHKALVEAVEARASIQGTN